MPALPPFDPATLREVARILGDTKSGLSNRELDDILHEAGIDDPSPKSQTPHTYVAISKRDRLFAAIEARQGHDRAANAVLKLIECAMHPVRYRDNSAVFEERRDELNVALAFAGLMLAETGKVARRSEVATTLDEARARSRRLRRRLLDRGVHPRILAACASEIADENYFHTVLEAAKSLAAEIREKTGLTADGVDLLNQALEPGQRHYPLLACNALQTPTDWSEQRGLTQMLRGVFSAFRNPTAHEPKVSWFLSEQDALDALSLMSWLHRKLDASVLTAASAASAVPP